MSGLFSGGIHEKQIFDFLRRCRACQRRRVRSGPAGGGGEYRNSDDWHHN
jgi:hypothetical protein